MTKHKTLTAPGKMPTVPTLESVWSSEIPRRQLQRSLNLTTSCPFPEFLASFNLVILLFKNVNLWLEFFWIHTRQDPSIYHLPSVHTHRNIRVTHTHRGQWCPFPVSLPGFPGSPAGPGGPRVPGIPVRPCSPAKSMKCRNGSPFRKCLSLWVPQRIGRRKHGDQDGCRPLCH